MKTILLADDSITIQKVVELTFSDADYQVVCVGNGAQALRKLGEVRPDIVLLDVIMPEKNGYEVCEQIKRHPSTSGIPVLLLTGTFEPFDKKRAEAAGADGHLTKPFESQLLVSRVEELIAATPRVATTEQAGVMDVISGGEVYRVDPSGGSEGMRRAAGAQAPPPGAGSAAGPVHPVPASAAPAPGPDAGGAYVGFADVGFGGEAPSIVPDRFDDAPPAGGSPATLRLSRDELTRSTPGTRPPAGTEGAALQDEREEFAGAFEPQFDLADDTTAAPVADPEPAADTGEWAPPPEAPPMETWSAAPAPSAGPGNGHPAALTPEAMDLIAEKVVQKLSDRVVREIAWEILPEVAEAVVRRRIKELEDGTAD
ncbi:MAG: response regulator [Candidatus Polarisedimenticolia bacterium]